MAVLVLKDARVEVNSVQLSDHVRSVTLTVNADEVEDTNMGDNTHVRLAGLKDWSISVEFAQNFAAASVDATLFPLIGAAAFPVKVRPTSGVVGPTNPEYSGNAILTEYSPIDGAVGDLATTSVNFVAAGDLTRATA
ncbi:MAG TPA: hypothetical protein VFQ79_07865 [Bryobacteraceae bacterium]|nr:hypothetical protein [Bryobacteraceae bacterium]